MSRSRSKTSEDFTDGQKLLVAVIGVSIIALLIYSVSSCGCGNKNTCTEQDTEESYQQEFNGVRKYSDSYRKYMSNSDDTFTLPRDRCKNCKGYNNYSFEAYEAPYKTCPHNYRQYGVSLCDQGTIM